MEWLASVCVRRPVFTWVLIVSLAVIGVASIFNLGVDRFPRVDFPVVSVVTVLPGASPQQVETEVSDALEEELNSLSDLQELQSISSEGISVVYATFHLDKDASAGAQEVRDHVNRVLGNLPSGILPPRVEILDPDAAPIMLVGLTGPRSLRETTEYGSRVVRRRIESIAGVGGVSIVGGRARQINVVLDPGQLQAFGLTVTDVQRALATQNVEVPSGTIHRGTQDITLRVAGRVESVEALNDLAVWNRGGLTVRVRDVGRAIDGEEPPASIARVNGRETVILQIRKQSGANTVAVIDDLREQLGELDRSLPPGFHVTVLLDDSQFIRNAVAAVEEHLVVGGLLAALVVLAFLRSPRSTIIASLAIPTSIVATFWAVYAMGFTLNLLTLLALALSVGIVIDDAIVVLENIVRFIEEEGHPPARAAVLATREIGLAVLATTLSLVAVFLPVAFMGGVVGRFLKAFGTTMSFAIGISLVVSFTLTPMLASRWLKRGRRRRRAPDPAHASALADVERRSESTREPRAGERERYLAWRRSPADAAAAAGRNRGGGRRSRVGGFERVYLRFLAAGMRHRWVVGLTMIGSCATLGVTVPAVQKDLLPREDESRFEIAIRAPEGTTLEATSLAASRIASEVRALPGVASTISVVGAPEGDISGRSSNESSISVTLVPPDQRRADQYQIMQQVRELLARHAREHLRTLVVPFNPFGRTGYLAASVTYSLSGPDLARLDAYAAALVARLRRMPGVVDADSTAAPGRPAYVLRVDRARAADMNVNIQDLAGAIRLLVGDAEVGTFEERGERYEIHLASPDRYRSDIAAIQQMTVPTAMGQRVRLGDLVEVEEGTGPAAIARFDRQRMVTIYCNVLPGVSEADVLRSIGAAQAELHMAPGYSVSAQGNSKELGRAARSFATAIVLSFLFMYLVLAAQFESWIHPVTIMISLPLTLPFAIGTLVVARQSLNIVSMLGILVLFGIVKKNSILQVDHIRDLRRQGLARADAVMVGNRDRLRPILMTTIAFIAGMVPLVVSSGAGATTNRSIGTVIIGGQALSLLLTLVATPVAYTWFDDVAHSPAMERVGRLATMPLRAIERLFGERDAADEGEVEPDDDETIE